jgi:ubiquinone/menaquinone biosynthesis C-methylase UbiE
MSQIGTSTTTGKLEKTTQAATPAPARQPNPSRIFQLLNAFQITAALKAAVELNVFTVIGEGLTASQEIAHRVGAAERGIRILCDYLVIMGLLTKNDSRYALTPDAATFLDFRSPTYLGTVARFVNAPEMLQAYSNLTQVVRKGGTVMSERGSMEPDNPLWVEFARSMAPMMAMPSEVIAEMAETEAGEPCRVLDIAAGHGLFGIAIARRNPQAEIVALDWPAVLEVAKENARKSGIESRYSTIPGSAFDVELGTGYQIILLTNFLHHFDTATCEGLLRKVHAALAPGGRVFTLEPVPNDDRITPPEAASFSMVMLGTTPAGDAYTFAEFDRMFRNAGFQRSSLRRPENMWESVIVSYR